MSFTKKLLLNDEYKIIGLLGGKGRDFIANELAGELSREGKHVVITHLEKQMLPTSGMILFNENKNKLLKDIQSKIKRNPIIYVGIKLEDRLMTGIQPDMVKKIIELENVDYLLLILGAHDQVSIFPKKEINLISKLTFLDELIYCFQLDFIDSPMTPDFILDKKDFIKHFPQYKDHTTVRQNLMSEYLCDQKNGALKLFQQKWPCVLVFTDINNLLLENKVINLSRDLFSKSFKNIFQANFRDNLVKPVSAK